MHTPPPRGGRRSFLVNASDRGPGAVHIAVLWETCALYSKRFPKAPCDERPAIDRSHLCNASGSDSARRPSVLRYAPPHATEREGEVPRVRFV